MARMAAVASPNVMQRPERIPVEPLAESINDKMVTRASGVDFFALLRRLSIWKVTESLRTEGGKTVYHFFAVNGPVDIPLTETSGQRARKFATCEDAAFVEEQIRIKKEYYMTFAEIRKAVAAETGEPGSCIITDMVITNNISRKTVVVNGRQIEVVTLDYKSISHGGEIVRIKLRRDGNQYIISRKNAEMIIRDEIAKRRDFVRACDIARACGVWTTTVLGWCRDSGARYDVYGLHTLIPKSIAESMIAAHPDIVTPKGTRNIAPLLRKYGFAEDTFLLSITTRPDGSFFTYDAIESGKIVPRSVQVHKNRGGKWTITREDAEQFRIDMMEERRRWKTEELAAELGTNVVALNGRKKERPGFFWAKVDGEKIYLPYVVTRKKVRIDPDRLIEATWQKEVELARRIGLDLVALVRYKVGSRRVYLVPFERGQTVELRYAQLPSGTYVDLKPLEDARKWSECELAKELGIIVREVKKMADTERSVYVVRVGRRKIELPYRMKDGKPRIDVDNLIKATWPTLEVVTAELGVTQAYMERCMAAGKWKFRFVLDRGTKESTLGYTIVDEQIRINPKDWETVRKKLTVAK